MVKNDNFAGTTRRRLIRVGGGAMRRDGQIQTLLGWWAQVQMCLPEVSRTVMALSGPML